MFRVIYTKGGENFVIDFEIWENAFGWINENEMWLKNETTRVKALEKRGTEWVMRYHWQKALE